MARQREQARRAATDEAERLREHGAPLVQTSDHRLKVGHGNPWPATKVITIWTSPLGVEGSLTNPVTPGGQDGGEANPAPVHR